MFPLTVLVPRIDGLWFFMSFFLVLDAFGEAADNQIVVCPAFKKRRCLLGGAHEIIIIVACPKIFTQFDYYCLLHLCVPRKRGESSIFPEFCKKCKFMTCWNRTTFLQKAVQTRVLTVRCGSLCGCWTSPVFLSLVLAARGKPQKVLPLSFV